MPAVCRFFLKGYCRYGDSCRFEHPGENNSYQSNTSTSGFSFKEALNSTNYHSHNNANLQTTYSSNIYSNNFNNNDTANTSGFSFTKALHSTGLSFTQDDVDMSDGLFLNNRQSTQSSGFFKQAYQELQSQSQQIQPQPQYYPFSQPSQTATIFQANSFTNQNSQPFNQLPFQNTINQQSHPFGHTASKVSGSFSSAAEVEQNCDFSSIGELVETELRAFESEFFVLGKIPIKPPPKAFC